MLAAVKKGTVRLLPGLFKERTEIDYQYLMELDTQCLLQNFYLEAGIVMPGLQVVEDPDKANLHWGWEAPTCQLRGHFLGHWISAAAKYIAYNPDAKMQAKLEEIISELAKCQELNGGEWIGPFPEKYFTRLEKDQYIWSPQYVMHKLILGLWDAAVYTDNKQALEILDHLADWYLDWTKRMETVNPHAVYSGEEGGMLEVWVGLYETTRQEKYKTLANRYADAGLFRKLLAGKDPLTNCHANASVPFTHGAAKMYEITEDDKWLEIIKLFWNCAVTERGMFATSGQNAGEFWIPPHMQGHFLGNRTQEFCTVYNMVRTALYLYEFTGEVQYADYIERCLYNGFLAQQNAVTATPTYFLPLSAGSHKKWGSKTRDFWCCHGTMVQAPMLFPELIYFEEGQSILISQYIPSVYKTELDDVEVEIEQTLGMKYYNDQAFFDEHDDGQMSRWLLKFQINTSERKTFALRFRIPSWVEGTPDVKINGEKTENLQQQDGYLVVNRDWEKDEVQIYFPNGLRMEQLEDMPELGAVMDGPIVLAGLTDADCGLKGDFTKPEQFMVPQYEHTYETFPWRQTTYQTRNQERNMIFKPLYEIMDEAYTVYFTQK